MDTAFKSLGDEARLVLDGLVLKMRAPGAATPFPRNFPKRTGEPEGKPAKFGSPGGWGERSRKGLQTANNGRARRE